MAARVTAGALTLDTSQGAQAGSAISLTTTAGTAHGIYITGGSLSILNGPVNISTAGSGSSGLWTQNAGSSVTALAGGLNIVTTGTMTTGAVGAYGLLASNGTTVRVDGATIRVDGAGSTGPYAFGGNMTLANTSVRTTAINPWLVGTTSYGAYGIVANVQSGVRARLSMTDGTIDTLGTNANAAYSNSSEMILERVTITTAGSKGHGLLAANTATLTGSNVTVTTTGPGAYGARTVTGSSQTLTNSSIRTSGDDSYALIAMGNNSSVTGTNVSIASTGPGAPGATAWASNATDVIRVELTGGSVTTSGADSEGVISNEANSTVTLNGTRVTTSGAFSNALKVNGGTLSVTGGSIIAANGPDSAGLATGGTSTAISRVTLTDATVSSSQSDGIAVASGNAQVDLLRTSVTGAPRWLRVGDVPASSQVRGARAPALSNTVSDPNSEAAGIGEEALPAGPISAPIAAPIQATIVASAATLNGSALTGSGAVSDVTLRQGTVWNMTGDSNLTNLNLDSSRINFSAPVAGAFKTLTVHNHVGTAGTLAMNTYLGGDGSPSDKLVIDGGSATGRTSLAIANAGGGGAVTPGNGILVVDAQNAGTTAAGSFVLAGPVVAGPYEYTLSKSARDGGNDQAWYLRSEAPAPAPPPPPVPPAPAPAPSPEPAPQPLYRPEVGAYLSNQRQAGGMFVHSLHDRLGEPQWIEGQQFDNQDDRRRSGWLRVVNKNTDGDSRDGIFSTSTNSTLVQAGGDMARWAIGGDRGRMHAGAMLGFGQSDADTNALYNPRQAHGEVKGWSIGAYGTWFQNDENKLGAYVDLWGTYGWFNNSVRGDGLPEVKYNARALTLSAEGGYALKIADTDWVVEPQGQLVYVKYNEDDITESNGTRINGGEGSGWISRLGVRLHRTWVRADGRRLQPYLTLNWWHDSTDNMLAFNAITLSDVFPSNRYEAKLGLNADLTKGWSAWGNAGYQWGAQSFRATTFRIGAKYTW